MANSKWVPPVLPRAPDQYDRRFMSSVLSQLEILFQAMAASGDLRCGTLNISQLPTSATGLRTGDLWNDAGTVKVV